MSNIIVTPSDSSLWPLFEKEPFVISHDLVSNPLFELPSLIELSRSLPERQVEYNSGQVPVDLDPSRTPRTGLSIEETIRRIEEFNSWLVLKNVERDPRYRQLLDRCLDEVQLRLAGIVTGMSAREGFIFVSSANAVTPLHLDPEHNFLLQIRGSKTVSVYDREQPEVLSPADIERYYLGGHRNLKYSDALERHGRKFDLGPGQGLHIPVNAPHWVKVHDRFSISFSVTFRSAEYNRRECVLRMNGKLRQLGLSPAPYGKYPLLDRGKYDLFELARKVRRLTGRTIRE